MKSGRKLIGLILLIVFASIIAFGGRINHILPLRERARVVDQWLKIRLDTVLPMIMEKGIIFLDGRQTSFHIIR